MARVLYFFIINLLCCACNDGGKSYSTKHNIDSSFCYSAKDFESFCEGLKNKSMSKLQLTKMFESKFDSTTVGDTTVFKFILCKHPEALDTCWGLIQYKSGLKKVNDYGIVCQ
jgi:hypothetical protein